MIGQSLSVQFVGKNPITYHGSELRPHYIYERFGVKGSAMVAFRGPCHVETEHLVDWEDRLASDRIEARDMIHFIGEFFGWTMREGVLLQRLVMTMIGDFVQGKGKEVSRKGDDIYVDGRKLTVSIATASPVSVLLHIGVNIDPEGAPVNAVGLPELDLDEMDLVSNIFERFTEEWHGIEFACTKVRPVV